MFYVELITRRYYSLMGLRGVDNMIIYNNNIMYRIIPWFETLCTASYERSTQQTQQVESMLLSLVIIIIINFYRAQILGDPSSEARQT